MCTRPKHGNAQQTPGPPEKEGQAFVTSLLHQPGSWKRFCGWQLVKIAKCNTCKLTAEVLEPKIVAPKVEQESFLEALNRFGQPSTGEEEDDESMDDAEVACADKEEVT